MKNLLEHALFTRKPGLQIDRKQINQDINFIKKLNGCNVIPYDVQIRRPD